MGKVHLVWSCERRLGVRREKDRKERETERAMLGCVTENFTEGGKLVRRNGIESEME